MDLITRATIRSVRKKNRRIKREKRESRSELNLEQYEQLVQNRTRQKHINELIEMMKAATIIGTDTQKFRSELDSLLKRRVKS